MTDMKQIARRALSMLDLTNLNDDCDEEAIAALAARACTDHGHVAALCVWPAFVEQAHGLVGHRGVKIATVVNFPGGEDPASEVMDLTKQAVGEGADEIDMVIPYRSLMEGREEVVHTRIKRVKAAAGNAKVKAILETGGDEEAIVEKNSRGIFLTSFLMIFAAEFGDKTQLAVAGMAAAQPALAVYLGSTLALITTTCLGVFGGRWLGKKIPPTALHKLGGILFLAFAAWLATDLWL